jgi:nicotinate-nucleotide adenylyltransferase
MNMAGRMTDRGDESKQWGHRIGVLGGTFDPVHQGHLGLAAYVLDVLNLDSILFVPAARPPHKGHAEVTPFHHRAAMLKIAVRDKPRFFVSELEAQRSGPSYSVDTLKELRILVDPGVLLFFIIGMDAFVELKTWKNFKQLLDYANLAVVSRPGFSLRHIDPVINRLGRYVYDAGDSCWIASDRLGRIHPLDMPHMDISSTAVREKARTGSSLAGLIPAAVSEYILQHKLLGGC